MCRELHLWAAPCDLTDWNEMLARIAARHSVELIAIVGKVRKRCTMRIIGDGIPVSCGLQTAGAVVHIKWVEAEEVNPYTAVDICGSATAFWFPAALGTVGSRVWSMPPIMPTHAGQTLFQHLSGHADALSSVCTQHAGLCGFKLLWGIRSVSAFCHRPYNDQKALDEKGGTMRLDVTLCYRLAGTQMAAQAYSAEEVRQSSTATAIGSTMEYRTARCKPGALVLQRAPHGRPAGGAVECRANGFYVGVQCHPRFKPSNFHPSAVRAPNCGGRAALWDEGQINALTAAGAASRCSQCRKAATCAALRAKRAHRLRGIETRKARQAPFGVVTAGAVVVVRIASHGRSRQRAASFKSEGGNTGEDIRKLQEPFSYLFSTIAKVAVYTQRHPEQEIIRQQHRH